LVLTKALGTGIIATAIKAGKADEGTTLAASRSMATLNGPAAEAMKAAGVRAATDVTGFGLLGHLSQMARASGVSVILMGDSIPVLPGVRELANTERFPGGTLRNMKDIEEDVEFPEAMPRSERFLLADAQTSGGLLMAVDPGTANSLLSNLTEVAPAAALIGEIREGPPGRIQIV
jgi:selenide,water dikinase